MFWAGGDDLDPDNVYARMYDEHVSGIDAVDRDRVLRAFADLPGWTWDGQFLRPPGTNPEGTPAYDVSIGEQLIEFIGYRFQGEHSNEIIDAIRHSATDSATRRSANDSPEPRRERSENAVVITAPNHHGRTDLEGHLV
ncbi:hypothetical protein BDB13_5785 [Rhodococcus sp. OK302]|nr:hypothetical protein BDB13_5785 [Rhodococcus sp. OK302]